MESTILVLVLVGVSIGTLRYFYRQRRRRQLIEKYGSPDIADRIMKHLVWQGMTENQLLDSWGKPADVARTVYKTKTKEVWKYQTTGTNRYRERITFENG